MCLCAAASHAQHIDEVHFGSPASELAHGLTGYDMSGSETYAGLNNETARRFKPDVNNPFQGQYTGIYGGEINLVVKVDGAKQNYFTAKFSGSESGAERILLEVNGLEVGNRYHGDEEFFLGDVFSANPGAFCFRTLPIPRKLTDGQTQVSLRLRSTGRFYGYGTSGQYATFQRAMESKTIGIYKLFVHTDPGFQMPVNETQSNSPSYSSAPGSSTVTDLAALKNAMAANANAYFTSLLAGSDFIPSDPNNFYHPVEAMAQAYHTPEITATYQNPAVVEKIFRYVENMVINNYSGIQVATASWGGAFGRQGYALSLIYDKLPDNLKGKLDEVINLGGGTGKTRRAQWCEVFRLSFNAGAARKTITNQEMESDASVFGASLALYKLDPVTYAAYPAIGLRALQEACGVEQYSGAIGNLSTVPTLGNPAASNRGAGYFWMTQKGTSHEPGWVAPDCYGNLGPKMMEMYMMTVHFLGGTGDDRILAKAVQHVKTQSKFTYPFIGASGNRSILANGYICVRNTAIPGETFYSSEPVAGISGDADLLGYINQRIADGGWTTPASAEFRFTSVQFDFQTIDRLLASSVYQAKVPTTPGEPDFFYADEENGIVTIKHAGEQLFLNFYYRDGADNKIVRGNHLSANAQRFLEFVPVKTEFRPSSSVRTRDRRVNGTASTFGTPPDDPENARNGQVEQYPSYDGTSKYDGNRLIKDYYFARYGRYLIAMNTRGDAPATIEFPADLVGQPATDLSDQESINLPATLALAGRTTKVFFLTDPALAGAGLATDNTDYGSVNKTALLTMVSEKELFAQTPDTKAKVSLIAASGRYKHVLFLDFMRQLANAKYMANNDGVYQTQVDDASTRLNAAYVKLVGETYAFDPVVVPAAKIDYYNKKVATGGRITVNATNIGETQNNAFIVVPIQADQTGRYIVKIKAGTVRAQNVSPRLNVALLAEGVNYLSYIPLAADSRVLSTSASWNDVNEYKWIVSLTENEVKLFRLSFLVNDASWCANVTDIDFSLTTPCDELDMNISEASQLLALYSNVSTPAYSKVTDLDRSGLQDAITTATTARSVADADGCVDAIDDLAAAVTVFNNAISSVSVVRGIIDMGTYVESSGNNVVAGSSGIGSTKNGAWLIYKFKAGQAGSFVPGILASTNSEASANPRVNLQIGADLAELKARDLNTANTVGIVKGPGGWNTFNPYSYNPVTLVAGQEYYLKVSFLTGVTWCANLSQVHVFQLPDITLNDRQTVYDGTAKTLDPAVLSPSEAATNVVSYSYRNDHYGPVATAPVQAGVYMVTATSATGNSFASGKATATLTIDKAEQTINFAAQHAVPVTSVDFQAGATASSGANVEYVSSDPGVATIIGGKIHITGVGTTTLTATQAGDVNYKPVSAQQLLTVAGSTLSAPFKVHQIEGTVQAEDYDLGSQNLAYYVGSAGVMSNPYRPGDLVGTSLLSEGNYAVTDTKGGNWLKYTIQVTASANYAISMRYSSSAPSATQMSFKIIVDPQPTESSRTLAPKEYIFSAPGTGDPLSYGSKVFNLDLTQGTHVLQLVFDAAADAESFNIDSFTFTNAGPLPVTLSDFKASKVENSVLLYWVTTQEINSEQFEVQHSRDARNWEPIGNVQARQQSSALQYYHFTDDAPHAGENLYRLKMIDRDGTYALSSIRAVSFNGPAIALVYPNPVAAHFDILLADWENVKEVKLFDLAGRQVYKSGKVPDARINTAFLSNGVYLVRIARASGETQVLRVVVSK